MAAERNKTILNRSRVTIGGIVQGVGFRPFVFRLAHELALSGWVRNTPAGVELEFQGEAQDLATAIERISSEAPPLAVISSLEHAAIPVIDESGFRIMASSDGAGDIQVAPDSAVCADCLQELRDAGDRRHAYPFITCTNCGPRYSIITDIPYDRPNTTMAGFPLCPDCQCEYDDPHNRRFHAQPLACPVCGPRLTLRDRSGGLLVEGDLALSAARELLTSGKIVAIKGLGGYHLSADACNADAVRLLRQRKQRDEKPFAVMVPDLVAFRRICRPEPMEERLLSSPETPVVIARKAVTCPVADQVAPGNGWLGVMLPYTPLHHLLFRDSDSDIRFEALVMTSGNLSDEPIAFRDEDALERLAGIADAFLLHNRPIHTRCDDSVMRVFQGQPLFYRRSRGYVPRAIRLPFNVEPLLATGAELKSAVCLASGDKAFLSQHIGDLQNDATSDSFRYSIEHLCRLLRITPARVACDQHPDYLSSLYAEERSSAIPLTSVQHHHAHMAACMAENGLTGDVIGLIFDGTGLGQDGTIWGGEFLVGGYGGFHRAGCFRPVRLPGGDRAVREPWRMALSCLYSARGAEALHMNHPLCDHLSAVERPIFSAMLERGINSPFTSSCGRLFDAAAALLGVRHSVSYDGQAAIELEALAELATGDCDGSYPFTLNGNDFLVTDILECFPALRDDIRAGVDRAALARRFHATVATAAVATCRKLSTSSGLDRVVLSGGVFQNRLLTEMVYTGLTNAGLNVFTHRLTPPNDGCIALGQAAVAGWKSQGE